MTFTKQVQRKPKARVPKKGFHLVLYAMIAAVIICDIKTERKLI